MKFKILPLLLASVVGINSFAQSPARLSAFSVKVQSGSTTNVLDTVKYLLTPLNISKFKNYDQRIANVIDLSIAQG